MKHIKDTINYIYYKMPKEIVFESINVEDPFQKTRIQFESKIFNMVNGKQLYADEETGFINQKYSGYAPKKFNPDPSKRDFVRFNIDTEQSTCIELKNILNEYDDSFEANRKTVFGKYDRLYKFGRSIKQPRTNDEEELSDDDEGKPKEPKEETKEQTPKFETCKMKLKMDWFYYYQEERLDKSNTNIVKKAVSDLMTKNKSLDKDKRKALIGTLTFKLNFMDDLKSVQKDVNMSELEQRKEIDTKIFYRRPNKLVEGSEDFLKKLRGSGSKDISDYEKQLVDLFGDPGEPKDVRTPDELDKYYNYNCHIRILFAPFRVWAAKQKENPDDKDSKRKCGIKYQINCIDIIQLPFENNSNSFQKTVYSKYAFGKRNNDYEQSLNNQSLINQSLINQSTDTVFTAVKNSVEKTDKVETSTDKVETSTDKVEKSTEKNSKNEKKQMKVESEESEEESEESEEESEESESDEEPEPPKKTGKGKTVVEAVKSTKTSNKKTK